MKSLIFAFIFVSYFASVAISQEEKVSPSSPKDQPTLMEKREHDAAMRELTRHIEKARETYPNAKTRYLQGLGSKQSFFVTIELTDVANNHEQVFLLVDAIRDEQIEGRIWSDIQMVKGFKKGDKHRVAEKEIVDWLITHSDGTEEGNYVGKFLDEYRKKTGRDPY